MLVNGWDINLIAQHQKTVPDSLSFSFCLPQENKASKNLIEHLKDQIGDKETKVKELEEIQNTIINMMQATKKKKTG